MNAFDVLLIVLVGLLALLGVMKGLTRLLIGIGALVAAFILASQFHGRLAERLGAWVDLPDSLLRLGAYLAIFLGTMLAGGVVAFILRRLLRAAMLSWADRLAGAALGTVAALLAAALIVLPVVAYAPDGERVLRNSVLAPYVTVVADVANHLVPEGLSAQYRSKMESLRRYWRDRWAAAGSRAA